MTLWWMVTAAIAAEGMWLPEQVPAVAPAFADKGLRLDPAALADPLGDPLGAIVSLGGCSASFVSADGLVATNHHCVEGYLQYLSTPEINRHQDGFVAPTRADEAWAGPGAKLRIVERVTDVTTAMLKGVSARTSDRDRKAKLEANDKVLVATCEKQADRRCFVTGYFGGSTYRLVQTFEIEDVRVVFAPPMSVGQFGGDVDNWMWPRHGADFAFLRAYVSPTGEAATFAPENVPYRPPHHLKLAPTGVSEGDFVMIAGFPGRTARHRLHAELAWEAAERLPRTIERAEVAIRVLEGHAASSTEAAGKVGPRISGLANRKKKSEAVLEGVAQHHVLEAVAAEEAALVQRMTEDPAQWSSARRAYDELKVAIAESQGRAAQGDLVGDLFTAALLGTAYDALRWANERMKPDPKRELGFQDRDLQRRLEGAARLERSLHLPADRDLFILALDRYLAAPAELRLPAVDAWIANAGGRDAALEALYTDPVLSDAEARADVYWVSLASLTASADPWMQLARALDPWLTAEREADKARSGASQRLRAAWMSAKRALLEANGLPMYDDANGTLRLTFGHVQGYAPQDGLIATPFTKLSGIPPKAGPAPFDVPPSLLDRVPSGPTSRWAAPALGDVPVDFLCDLDITGGNSGSAVLDGQGRLVGLAFDGVWESVASDWHYLDPVNRTVVVDLRYMLWTLEGEPGAARLMNELGVGTP